MVAPVKIKHTHVHSLRIASGEEALVARVLAADGTEGFGFTLNMDAGVARDMAAWDALGRSKGIPLWGLLGGTHRREISVAKDENPAIAPDWNALRKGILDNVYDLLRIDPFAWGSVEQVVTIAASAQAFDLGVALLAPNAHPWEIQHCAALAATFKGEDTKIIVRSSSVDSTPRISNSRPGNRLVPGTVLQHDQVAKLAVSSVRLTRVSIPLTMVHAGSMYVIQKAERTVVELTLDNGVVGLGDTWGTPEVFGLAKQFAKGWLDKDALDRVALRTATLGKSNYDNKYGRNGRAALAGLDLAAWDAVAQSLKMSLADLIGARKRESIDVVSTLPAAILPRAVSRDELTAHLDVLANTRLVVDFAREQVRKFGFRNFKLKSAAYSPDWDWKLLNELREAMPTVRIRFDPNANYGPATAIALCKRLDNLGLEFFEDPTGEIEGIARLRASVKTPVATNMWVVKDEQLAPAIRRQAVDVVLGDLFMWGGIDAVRRMAKTARAFGLKPALHSVYETGISTVANLHLASAIPEFEYPNDASLHFMSADVLTEPQSVVDGKMQLPRGFGLGVTLDRAKLEKVALETAEMPA